MASNIARAVCAMTAMVILTACDTPQRTTAPGTSISSAATTAGPITGSFSIDGVRSLVIDCAGSGKVTVVLEVGFDAAGTTGQWRMQSIRDKLTPGYRVCNYDRANLGRSDPAAKPRTTADIADDLAALLKAAQVPGPYLLVGVSAGGLYVQHFAARHPDQVIAVLALNPETRADKFSAKVFPLFTAEERAGELAYQVGQNSQGIDYSTSAKQIEADGPLPVPLTIMESVNLCPEQESTCKKAAQVIPDIHRGLVDAAEPGGKYLPVNASHNLYLEVPEQVVAEVERLAAGRR